MGVIVTVLGVCGLVTPFAISLLKSKVSWLAKTLPGFLPYSLSCLSLIVLPRPAALRPLVASAALPSPSCAPSIHHRHQHVLLPRGEHFPITSTASSSVLRKCKQHSRIDGHSRTEQLDRAALVRLDRDNRGRAHHPRGRPTRTHPSRHTPTCRR